MNIRAAFWPVHRADPDDYWLALGLIALIDALRLSVLSGGAALSTWLIVMFFLASAHINRLRDAGRRSELFAAPLAAGVTAKLVGAIVAMTAALWPYYLDFLDRRGVDLTDPAQLEQAARDQVLMREFQESIMGDETLALELIGAAAWPSMIAFWAVVFALGFWFARMRRTPQE